jgi:hypothetical protein
MIRHVLRTDKNEYIGTVRKYVIKRKHGNSRPQCHALWGKNMRKGRKTGKT